MSRAYITSFALNIRKAIVPLIETEARKGAKALTPPEEGGLNSLHFQMGKFIGHPSDGMVFPLQSFLRQKRLSAQSLALSRRQTANLSMLSNDKSFSNLSLIINH